MDLNSTEDIGFQWECEDIDQRREAAAESCEKAIDLRRLSHHAQMEVEKLICQARKADQVVYQYTSYHQSSLLNVLWIKERLKECEITQFLCQWCESSATCVIELEAQMVICNKQSDFLLLQLDNNVIVGIMNRAISFPCPKLHCAEQIWCEK